MDGSEKARVEKPKPFPSGVDPAGAAVWFGSPDPDHEFVVAEGIESALSAMRILGVAAGCAALSTWGIRCLVLPSAIRRVTVFADSDELQQGVAAANEARRRWRSEGRTSGCCRQSETAKTPTTFGCVARSECVFWLARSLHLS